MSKAFITEVTDKNGKVTRKISEVGGMADDAITAEWLQNHYDDFQKRDKVVQPFPGARSVKVLAHTETVAGDRAFDAKTPPKIDMNAPAAPQATEAPAPAATPTPQANG